VLAELVRGEMRKRGLSARAFARESGVSHTTIIRILEGQRVDVATIKKICDYLNVRVADVITSEYDISSDARLIAQITTLVERTPALAAVFRDAFQALDAGIFTLEDVQEIVNFAAYKMNSKMQDSSVQTNKKVIKTSA